jgi:hypothetical protein
MDPALSALIGGLVGGLFAAVVSGFVTLRVQARQQRHDLEKARVERLQRRREIAYEKMLTQVFRIAFWVERTNPVIGFSGARPPPEPSPDEELIALNATTAAHASTPVRESMKTFSLAHRAFQAASWRLDFERDQPTQHLTEIWQAIEAERASFRSAVEAVTTAVNNELAEP